MIDRFLTSIDRFRGRSRLTDRIIDLIRRFHRLIEYGICGAINTAVDWAIFGLLYHFAGLPAYVSHGFGFIAGSVCGYTLNSRFTFHEGRGRTKAQGLQYVGIDAVLFVSSSGLMKLMDDEGWNVWLVEIGLTAVFALIHYVLYKFLVFRIRKEDDR